MSHFAKVCRKQKNSKPQNPKKRTVNTVDEEPHPEDSMSFLQSSKLYESGYSSGQDNMFALIQNDSAKIEPLNMPIKIGNISTALLVDTGSACSFLNRSLTSQVVRSSPHAFWIDANPQLRIFSSEPIHIEGKVQAPVSRMDFKLGHINGRRRWLETTNRYRLVRPIRTSCNAIILVLR